MARIKLESQVNIIAMEFLEFLLSDSTRQSDETRLDESASSVM